MGLLDFPPGEWPGLLGSLAGRVPPRGPTAPLLVPPTGAAYGEPTPGESRNTTPSPLGKGLGDMMDDFATRLAAARTRGAVPDGRIMGGPGVPFSADHGSPSEFDGFNLGQIGTGKDISRNAIGSIDDSPLDYTTASKSPSLYTHPAKPLAAPIDQRRGATAPMFVPPTVATYREPTFTVAQNNLDSPAFPQPGFTPLPPGIFDEWRRHAERGLTGLYGALFRDPTHSYGGSGYPDKPGCDEEWTDARKICSDELAKRMPSKKITGGHKNIEDCARGWVSERCGGNSYDRK
jgi:hypothetical protein